MLEMFLALPMEVQIILAVAMLVGLVIMYKFRYIVLIVAAGAIAVYVAFTSRLKKDK